MALAARSQGINHNPEMNIESYSPSLSGSVSVLPCLFILGHPSAHVFYAAGSVGQDSPRRRISGSLYEIRMSACLLFQQPAFIDPTCSSLGRLPNLEKNGGTDCNPVAMHGSLWALICSAFPSKQQQQII